MRIALSSEAHFLHRGSRYFLQKFPTILILPQTIPTVRDKAPRDRPERLDPMADQELLVRVDGSTGQVEHSPNIDSNSPIVFWKRHKLVSAEAILSGLGTDQ